MEAAVFILSLVDCCALIFLSVYFVSFMSPAGLELFTELIPQPEDLVSSPRSAVSCES